MSHSKPCLKCEKCPKVVKHEWRNTCSTCTCPLSEHTDYGVTELRALWEKLQIAPKANRSGQAAGTISNSAGRYGRSTSDVVTTTNGMYPWAPEGVPKKQLDEFLEQIRNSGKLPKGVSMASQRERQLRLQLPLQDFHSLLIEENISSNSDEDQLANLAMLRDEVALGVGKLKVLQQSVSCTGRCGKDIATLAPCVYTDKARLLPEGRRPYWHPACFCCSVCEQPLVDLVHCYHEESLYCVRHYDELHRKRCRGCDCLIFSQQYVSVKGDPYHMEHHACSRCDTALTGKRYVLRDEKPCCINCYEQSYANRCEACNKAIGTDCKDLSYKGRHWHESCFVCHGCKGSLASSQFIARDNDLFCGNCYDGKFAAKCDACSATFKSGMKKYEYKGKKFHDACFVCVICRKPIGSGSFVPRENDQLVCMGCYEGNVAQRCTKCAQALTTGGVTFQNAPYHKECFVCTECRTELANTKFATKDDAPYCAECYVKNFSKVCDGCHKPIAGIGEATKYVTFEGKQWHSDCFTCHRCPKNLVGQGFVVDDDQVTCTECAKA